MPELPEVETVRRGLLAVFEGARIERVEARRDGLRFPFPERFVERLAGRRVLALRRRAKYLVADLDSGETLAMHLGMTGSFRIEDPRPLILSLSKDAGPSTSFDKLRMRSGRGVREDAAFYYPRGKAAAHDHVVFDFESGARVVYNDPRRFGFMTLATTSELDRHPLFADIGVEPLSDDFDAAALIALMGGVRAPLKAALLDQKRIAGLGNIYVCESLHRARLSPLTPAGAAARAKLKTLAKAIRAVLEEALDAGGSTLRDFRHADGELGYFQHAFAVYDREGAACPHRGCGGTIARIVQSGRSTFYCPDCQT